MDHLENSNKYEVIDNEKINEWLKLLDNKIDITINEKTKALSLLNEIDKLESNDIDLVYDTEKQKYYLVLWNTDTIKSWDFSEKELMLVRYLPFEGVNIKWLEEIINYSINSIKEEQD